MALNPDFSDLFAAFCGAQLRYLVWRLGHFQIGVAPNRIDILTAIDGVTFADAWPDRQETRYSDQVVPVIGLLHLLQNKRATGRSQDLLDAEEL